MFLAIFGVLLAISVPAVVKVRETALRLQSENNMRQIGLATHAFASAHADEFPNIDGRPRSPNAGQSMLFALLPYIGEEPTYRTYYLRPRSTIDVWVRTFVSPADPTGPTPHSYIPGATSYAANAQVFWGRPLATSVFLDGASNTIAFAEHYAVNCGGVTFCYGWDPNEGPHRATFADGGPKVNRFANCGDDYPITTGTPPISNPTGPTFQVAPRDVWKDCDPRLANTPHKSGMLVALGDCSIRTLAPGIDSRVYWGAVTPSGGEILEGW